MSAARFCCLHSRLPIGNISTLLSSFHRMTPLFRSYSELTWCFRNAENISGGSSTILSKNGGFRTASSAHGNIITTSDHLLCRDCRTFTTGCGDTSRRNCSGTDDSSSDTISKQSVVRHDSQLDASSQAELLVLTEHSDGTPVSLKTEGVVPGMGQPPEVPTFCCLSGCPSCVWIVFAAEMSEYYKDGGERARIAIEALEDQNMKSFLLMELEDVLKKE